MITAKYLTIIFLIFFTCSELFGSKMSEMSEENTMRIDELEERLDTVERATLVDRIDFSADIRMTMNNYFYFDGSKPITKSLGLIDKDGETIGATNMRARLKFVSRMGDKLKLSGWLTMYKQFLESAPGRYESPFMSPTYDLTRGVYPGNSMIYMERLYIDWFVTDWMAFSVGRAPALDGVPSNLRFNTVSLSTFADSQFTTLVDGFYITFNLDTLFSLQNSYFRICYVPRAYIDTTIPNNLFILTDSENQHIISPQLDLEIPGTNGSRLMWQATYTPYMKTGDIMRDVDGDGVEEKLTVPDSFGTLFHTNLMLMFYRAFNTDIDLFISGAYMNILPEVRTPENNENGIVGLPGADSENVKPLLSVFGNDMTGNPLHGYMLYTGFRYHTPWRFFNDNVKVGAEYTYSSKHFYFYHVPDTTGLMKLGVSGHSAETYITFPIHRKANIRLDYILQRHQHPYSLLQPVGTGVPEIKETIHNINFMINVYF